MLIKGFQKLTLLDYPGKTACTVFTGGCNYRCPFCHNAGLVTKLDTEIISESEVLSHLKKRQGILDGVAISGGEPLLQGDIEEFLQKIKELGYSIKLDTNGSFPDKLKSIIDKGLCDYVAMDIKNSPAEYGKTVGVENFDITPIKQSIEIIKQSGVDYEFRTTVVHEFHEDADFEEIGQMISGAKHYFLQCFTDRDTVPFEGLSAPSKEKLEACAAVVSKYVKDVQIRGVD